MQDLDEPKELMEKGWKAREELEFDTAEELLKKALDIFEKSEDWFNVTECLNHLAYNEKLRAVQNNHKGLEYAKKSLEISKAHSTKTASVLRALMSLSSSSGLFEQALEWTDQILRENLDTFARADILSHKATFLLRTGNPDKAREAIEQSERLFEDNEGENKKIIEEPHKSIWKSRMLMTKGIILINMGNLTEAKDALEYALKIAKDHSLKTRISEIEKVIELLRK